jgi:hypothetical protein
MGEQDEEETSSFPEDMKYAYLEHMDLASRSFWGDNKNFKSSN